MLRFNIKSDDPEKLEKLENLCKRLADPPTGNF
jgi:hypothetical protein